MRAAQKILWNCYFFIAFTLITIIVVIISPFVIPIIMVYTSISIGSAMRRGIRFYGWLLVCKVPFFAPVKVIYQGKKIPKKSIFVANHNSAIDPYLFGAIPVETGFVTSWPFKIPLYKYFMGISGYANAEKGWHEISEKSQKMLNEGCHVIIWPEGHRSRDRQISRFKSGAFRLAFETGTPIVPVCIVGSGDIMAPGERFLSCGKVTLVVLDPVYPEDKTNRRDDVQLLRRHVQTTIEDTLKEYGHFD
ncbi:1-acyl-sn-glycerol-3-phosphate acyltransferase [Desulforhopalus vacuolatus]|uniref:lysophospholipid acyltransferase family protein n=1 Tax=Desulforhopalus vacuolatus TaxID=40414 RepID=UPI0019669ECF|nr:lysophospholipid acyltransferase family protein [Desulforhopalus vacuolatus]MBM9519752.1 1-acyl-sn-glycerol-3-phosphate acyltransferase [Desulforhopalus vacuolatus]